jgi:hypothetical protein
VSRKYLFKLLVFKSSIVRIVLPVDFQEKLLNIAVLVCVFKTLYKRKIKNIQTNYTDLIIIEYEVLI